MLIWACKHLPIAFSPTATTIWMCLAMQILPLINNTPQSAATAAATTTATFLIMVVSQMVAL